MPRHRLLRHRLLLAVILCVTAFSSLHAQTPATQDKLIATLRDYAQQPVTQPTAAINPWNWAPELKRDAKNFSQMQVIDHEGRHALSIKLTDQLPWGATESHRVLQIGPDLLPPTADAVSLRVRVLEGSFTLSVGGPTIYFGNSDVQTQPITLTAKDAPAWRTVTLSLHDQLVRNFRRAGFARESPVIYYPRWIQEPLFLCIHRGSAGTLLIERADLLNQGRGQPYPSFKPEDIKTIASISDFANPDSLAQVFTATHEPADLSGPPKLTRPTWKPPILGYKADAPGTHHGILTVEHQGSEEVVFTGIKVTPASEANAVAIDMRVTNPLSLEQISVDWLLYAAPPATPLNLDRLRPPEAWRADRVNAFDYYLTLPSLRTESFAFYHARRAFPNGKWTQVIIPLPDFVCVYAAGTMTPAIARQQAIDPAQVCLLGWLPSFRQHRQPTTFEIDKIQWVHVPGAAASLRSFPQIDPQNVKLIPTGPQPGSELKQMVPR